MCPTVIAAPEFATGQTYVFKYEAVLMGGLPEEGLARAGVKVRCKVLISAVAANTFVAKVNVINLYHVINNTQTRIKHQRQFCSLMSRFHPNCWFIFLAAFGP